MNQPRETPIRRTYRKRTFMKIITALFVMSILFVSFGVVAHDEPESTVTIEIGIDSGVPVDQDDDNWTLLTWRGTDYSEGS
jgi:hypothetical protein